MKSRIVSSVDWEPLDAPFFYEPQAPWSSGQTNMPGRCGDVNYDLIRAG
jgi:hypothetical protein